MGVNDALTFSQEQPSLNEHTVATEQIAPPPPYKARETLDLPRAPQYLRRVPSLDRTLEDQIERQYNINILHAIARRQRQKELSRRTFRSRRPSNESQQSGEDHLENRTRRVGVWVLSIIMISLLAAAACAPLWRHSKCKFDDARSFHCGINATETIVCNGEPLHLLSVVQGRLWNPWATERDVVFGCKLNDAAQRDEDAWICQMADCKGLKCEGGFNAAKC